MTDPTIVSLGNHTGNNRMISVGQALETALEDLRAGRLKASRCMLVFDDPGPSSKSSAYEVRRSNMSNTGALIALDILHDKYVRQIRGDE